MDKKQKVLKSFIKSEETQEERDLKYEIMGKANEFMKLCNSCKDDYFIDDVIEAIALNTPFDMGEMMRMMRLSETNEVEE